MTAFKTYSEPPKQDCFFIPYGDLANDGCGVTFCVSGMFTCMTIPQIRRAFKTVFACTCSPEHVRGAVRLLDEWIGCIAPESVKPEELDKRAVSIRRTWCELREKHEEYLNWIMPAETISEPEKVNETEIKTEEEDPMQIKELEQENAALREQLDSDRAEFDRELQKVRADLQAEQARADYLADELAALRERLAAVTEEKPAAVPAAAPAGPADVKSAAEKVLAKFSALQGLRPVIKGAETSAPVVWIFGDAAAHVDAIRSAGGKWSGKKRAWYFRFA